MNGRLPLRFWLETGTATASGILCLVTLIWKNWIEVLFGVDPDQSSGSLEWLIVFAALAIAVTSATLARREWVHRTATV